MRFESNLLSLGNNTGIEVPPAVVESFNAGKRPAVTVIVNGFEYRSTVAVMGGRYLIPFSADKRAATGLAGGDPIVVELTLDAAPRPVVVPDDLATALAAVGLREAFDALAPSARKAYAVSIEAAKATETRQRRIEAVVSKLRG